MSTPRFYPGSPDARSLAPATVSAIAAAGNVTLLPSGIGWITCITFANTASATANLFYLYDGTDGSGPLIAAFSTPGGGNQVVTPDLPGIPFSKGLYLVHSSGSATIVVTYIPVFDPIY